MDDTGKSKQSPPEEPSLPPLTAFEERKLGALGNKMKHFHDALQSEFETSYGLADGSFYKKGMNLERFLDYVDEFRNHLSLHHDIEEKHVFPTLAEKMPEFRPNERHKASHKLIHDGLDKVGALVEEFRKEPSSYSPARLREALDSFREPLYTHLDEEVRDLQAENMRRYWSVPEVSRWRF